MERCPAAKNLLSQPTHDMLVRPGRSSPAFFAAGCQIGSLEEKAADGKEHNICKWPAAVDRDDERDHCQQDPQRR